MSALPIGKGENVNFRKSGMEYQQSEVAQPLWRGGNGKARRLEQERVLALWWGTRAIVGCWFFRWRPAIHQAEQYSKLSDPATRTFSVGQLQFFLVLFFFNEQYFRY